LPITHFPPGVARVADGPTSGSSPHRGPRRARRVL